MSRRWVLAWVVLVVVSSVTQAQTPYGSRLLPTRTGLSRLGLERHWMAAVPLVGTERVLEVSIHDNLLFAQTSRANFHCYDAESGRLLWTARLGAVLAEALPASVNSKLVFVNNANLLYALDRNTGRTVWVENLQVLPSSPTACDDERVMVGLSTGMLRGFTLKTKDKDGKGEHIATRAQFAWNWQTNGAMKSRPLPAGRLVVFGSRDGRIHVAMSDTPTMVYRIATGGDIAAAISGYGTRTILAASADKNLYAIDLFTAEVLWAFSSGAPLMQEPLVADDDAYVVNTSGVLNAVDIKSGKARWSTPTHGGKLVSVSATRIYLETQDDDLFIVDRATGRMVADPRSTHQRAGVDLREYRLGPMNSLNDRIYLGTESGLLLSLREIGQIKPRLLRNPKSPPFGYIPPEGFEKSPSTAPPATPKDESVAPAEEKPAPADEKPAEDEKAMPKEDAEPK